MCKKSVDTFSVTMQFISLLVLAKAKFEQILKMENAAQLFNNALATLQLAILTTFSYNKIEDEYNSAQWLKKILNHIDGTDWNCYKLIQRFRVNPAVVAWG